MTVLPVLQICLRRLRALQEKQQACSLPSALDDCEDVSGCRKIVMPGYRPMITMYYNKEPIFACQVISSKHIETFRNIIRQPVYGRL